VSVNTNHGIEAFIDYSNTLGIDFFMSSFTDDELIYFDRVCNELASKPMLVEHCVVKRESAEYQRRTVFFRTSEPIELWNRLRARLYENETIGPRFSAESRAIWRGEDIALDMIWVHRNIDPEIAADQSDGFENRYQCPECERFFCRGKLYRDRCPYCNEDLPAK